MGLRSIPRLLYESAAILNETSHLDNFLFACSLESTPTIFPVLAVEQIEMTKTFTRLFMVFLLLTAAQQAAASLVGEEVSFQRVFQGQPWPQIPEESTFIVGPGIEFTQTVQNIDTYIIDVSSDSIRFEIARPQGSGFGDAPPHELRFFLPLTILDASIESENFAGINQSSVSFTRNKLVVDVNNLNPIPFGGFFEVNLNLGAPAKAVPFMSPLSLTLLVLGMTTIFVFYRRKLRN